MVKRKNEKNWNDIWKNFHGLNWFGKRLYREIGTWVKEFLKKIKLEKNSRIIDIGCGSGKTLKIFRDLGYKNSIGIDNSKNSIALCKSLFGFIEEKDIFKLNFLKNDFKNHSFDLVFADSLLEHFKNFSPFVKEMCRISKHYVLITQPNHFSLFTIIRKLIKKDRVHEYTYKIEDFSNAFKNFGFELCEVKNINLNEHWLLLYRKI